MESGGAPVAGVVARSSSAGEIADIEAIAVELPPRREWLWRGLQQPLGRWVVIKLTTTSGIVGVGEATPLADWGGDFGRYYGETVGTVCHVVRDVLAPSLVGRRVESVGEVTSAMNTGLRGHPYAKAAIEMALHDALGKGAGLPVSAFLGGSIRSGVVLAHMIGLMPVAEAVAEAQAAVGDGIRALQVKGNGDARRDVELIGRLRETLSGDVHLRLDANCGYRSVLEAVRAIKALADAGVDIIEQPIEGLDRLAAVRSEVSTPIIADESVWSPVDAQQLIRDGAADAISIYVAKAGGLRPAREIAELADLAGVRCDVNGSLESGIGTAANLHLAAAAPAIDLPCVISASAPKGSGVAAAGRYYSDDLLASPLTLRDGVLHVPEGPGLGVELDQEKLEAYRMRVPR
jgi:L-alanine-DL-glutamate epimerase-like enolase superfamily enzyme